MKAFVIAAVLLSSSAFAAPPTITPSLFPKNAVGSDLYANIYRLGTSTVEYVSKTFAGKKFEKGSKEEQCLRQESMLWHLDQLRQNFKGAIYSDEAVAAILRALRGPGGGGEDRCTPDNAGYKAWKAFMSSVDGRKKEALSDAIQDKLRDLGRPVKESDVAAVLGAALLSSGVVRNGAAASGAFIFVDPSAVENPVKRWTSEDGT